MNKEDVSALRGGVGSVVQVWPPLLYSVLLAERFFGNQVVALHSSGAVSEEVLHARPLTTAD